MPDKTSGEIRKRVFYPPVLVAYEDRDDVEPDDPPYDKVQMCDGSWLFVHLGSDCLGEYCAVHQPSDHPLKDAPYNWRGDRLLMERLCEHGCGHPDPDDLAYKKLRFELHEGREATEDDGLWVDGVHGCCGCCGSPTRSKSVNPNEFEYVFRHGRPVVDPSNNLASHEEASKDLNESLEHFVQPPPVQVYKVVCTDVDTEERTTLWVAASDAEQAMEAASLIVKHPRSPFNGALTPTRAVVLPDDYTLPDLDLHDLAQGLEHLRPEEDEDREDPGPM